MFSKPPVTKKFKEKYVELIELLRVIAEASTKPTKGNLQAIKDFIGALSEDNNQARNLLRLSLDILEEGLLPGELTTKVNSLFFQAADSIGAYYSDNVYYQEGFLLNRRKVDEIRIELKKKRETLHYVGQACVRLIDRRELKSSHFDEALRSDFLNSLSEKTHVARSILKSYIEASPEEFFPEAVFKEITKLLLEAAKVHAHDDPYFKRFLLNYYTREVDGLVLEDRDFLVSIGKTLVQAEFLECKEEARSPTP